MTGYNPEWNEELSLVIADLSEELKLVVREYDAVHGGADEDGRALGYADVNLMEAVRRPIAQPMWIATRLD